MPGGLQVGVLEFISSLASSLAWPALVLVVVLMLKEPIKDVLSSSRPLKSLKAGPGGLEMEYALDAAQVELEKAQAERPTSPGPAPQPALPPTQEPLYRVSPAAAVLLSFATLERALRIALAEGKPDASRSRWRSVQALARQAVQVGILTESERRAIDELAEIRAYIAHGGVETVTEDVAKRFTEISDSILSTRSMRHALPEQEVSERDAEPLEARRPRR